MFFLPEDEVGVQNVCRIFEQLAASEGIPVNIMEALSAGIPVVATNVGGSAEAVNSKNGFLVPADFDCGNVAQIIDNYLNSPISEQNVYRQNAYDFWKEKYEAGKKYGEFLRCVLDES
jgi:glycosyltransferase involved in cell wall biosynthesis